MPRAAVAREAENKKRRREMAFSVVFDLLVMIVAVDDLPPNIVPALE
jgi:hypothetical protein